MGQIAFEILLVFVLLIINGIFSMSELSVVSARKIRLKQSAEKGSKGAQTALQLAESPNNFLSTVQIGITLVGILSGAFGGATIARELAAQIDKVPVLAAQSAAISFTIVVGVITYFSIIIGELIPKSIALNAPEKIASLVSRPMKLLSTVASPIVWMLSAPTSFVLRLFKVHAVVEPPVSDEEIKGLIDAGTKAGVFEESEQDLIESIIHLDDRRVVSLMTPRTKIVWLDTEDAPEKIKEELINSQFSRLPVCRGSLDSIVGYASAKSLLAHLLKESEINLQTILKQPLFVPETVTTLEVLEQFKRAHTHFAVVIDEFGGVEGLVTMHDVLEAIVGDLPTGQHSLSKEGMVLREDGSWLLGGQTSVIDLKEVLDLKEFPVEERDRYHTLAGFVMTHLGKVPHKGDAFEWHGFAFQVEAMEHNRVDKVLIKTVKPAQTEEL